MYADLVNKDISCWYAPECIKAGEAYAAKIIEGIKNAKIFVVIISKNSIKSEQVKNEIDRANNRVKDGLMILPLRIDDCDLDEECEYYLCRKQWFRADLPPIDEKIKKFAEAIKKLLV